MIDEKVRNRLVALLDEYRGLHKGSREMAEWLISRGVTVADSVPPKKIRRCTICRKQGHDQRTCPQAPWHDTPPPLPGGHAKRAAA